MAEPRCRDLCALALPMVLNACAQRVSRQAIVWHTDTVRLEGTLHLPSGPGPHPAAVFVHGSGTLTRPAPIHREHAERLSQMGVATLIYHKAWNRRVGRRLAAGRFRRSFRLFTKPRSRPTGAQGVPRPS